MKPKIKCVLRNQDGSGCYWVMQWCNGSMHYYLTFYEAWADLQKRLAIQRKHETPNN